MRRPNTRKIARQRIETLYRIAQETAQTEPTLSKRYVQLLRRIAQRTRTHLPPEVRSGICRKCDTVLIQGYNAHTRLKQKREPHIATTCHNALVSARPVGRNLLRDPFRIASLRGVPDADVYAARSKHFGDACRETTAPTAT